MTYKQVKLYCTVPVRTNERTQFSNPGSGSSQMPFFCSVRVQSYTGRKGARNKSYKQVNYGMMIFNEKLTLKLIKVPFLNHFLFPF